MPSSFFSSLTMKIIYSNEISLHLFKCGQTPFHFPIKASVLIPISYEIEFEINTYTDFLGKYNPRAVGVREGR